MLLKTEGVCNTARVTVMEETFAATIQQAALLHIAAQMETFAEQRAFTSCQRTFILLCFVCMLTAEK